MNSDSLELANMMSAMETRLSDKIGTVAIAVAGMKGEHTAKIESVELRVKDLEEENVREGWKEWLNRGGIVAVTMVIHKGANLIGWKI